MASNGVVLLEGARTPFGKFCGALREVSATDLCVISAKEALARSGVSAQEVDQVVIGNSYQSSKDAHLLARHVALKSGARIETPALTINRLCGSGLEAMIQGGRLIQTGESTVVLAGGTENMSQVPFVLRRARWGIPYGGSGVFEDVLWEGLTDTYAGCTMAMTAENLAVQYELTREEIDRHALSSHQRALQAKEKGYLRQEIVPVTVSDKYGETIVDEDEQPRNTSLEKLSRLRPRFKEGGVVTAGNASPVNDGASTVVLVSERFAEERGLRPIARLVSWGVVGVEPTVMGIGPVPAIRAALSKANLSLADVDLLEINEAFSAQYLACLKELDFDPDLSNVNGGAVALGHPMAATGGRIVLALLYELARRKKKIGVTAICIGGGQGIAVVWERL
ncbi:acetyl-CoA C-acetyltransferase [Alicyclobacillus kakegawensis]|uniref:acetyl-CoA C-acetyltransferase n=1 Tax=Alicyclobacillus kakegawensis TaxID=392012 RepID=UPI00082DB67B|nr:acetyl-CoA C-acetyltransferase [Alicyclobacillus kakegawensis]